MNTIADVVEKKLCLFCGGCAVVCPRKAISIDELDEKCMPVIDNNTCERCGTCVTVCPGYEVNFPEMRQIIFNEEKGDGLLGNVKEMYVGHATYKHIWLKSASGGVVTGLLVSLLEQGIIDGAIVLDFKERMPWRAEAKIATTKSQIIEACQSKYVMYPLNIIIEHMSRIRSSSLAYVGLPCHIHSIMKMKKCYPHLVEKIKYIIGLYCMNNIYYAATGSLFKRFNVKEKKDILSVRYREGNYPGNFTVMLKDGRKYELNKFAFSYLSYFYMFGRCLTCVDQTSEFADISVGDGWNEDSNAREAGSGQSVVLVRTDKGKEIIQHARRSGAIELTSIDRLKAKRMHSHVLQYKKKGAPARMKILSFFGKSVPHYGETLPVSGVILYMREALLLLFLRVCSLSLFRALVNFVPLPLIQYIMEFTRKTWRKKTQSI